MEALRKIFRKFGKLYTKDHNGWAPQLIHNVAIFGYADAPIEGKLFQVVLDVSKKLAEVGYVVVDGGGPGVMRAATLGAKDGGGKVVGVTLQTEDIPHFEGRDPKNLFDEEIKTDNYVERTLTLMREGQAYVVFNGGTGTISEFGMAWGLARLYFGHHKPLILYGKFWHNIMKAFKKNMLLRPHELEVYKIVSTPDGVIRALREFEEELEKGKHKHLEASKQGAFSL